MANSRSLNRLLALLFMLPAWLSSAFLAILFCCFIKTDSKFKGNGSSKTVFKVQLVHPTRVISPVNHNPWCNLFLINHSWSYRQCTRKFIFLNFLSLKTLCRLACLVKEIISCLQEERAEKVEDLQVTGYEGSPQGFQTTVTTHQRKI